MIKKKIGIGMMSLIFLNSFSQEWKNFTTGNSDLPGSEVRVIYIDDNDAKWFGTNNGLARLYNNSWQVYNTDDKLSDNSINDIAFQLSSYGPEIWLATDNGASVASFSADGITSATAYFTDNSGLIDNTVFSVTVDSGQVRYFGTNNGIGIFKGATWSSVQNSMLENNDVISANSTLGNEWNWFGTDGAGVIRGKYDEVDGLTGVTIMDTDWSGLYSNYINDIHVTDTNQFYGTNDGFAFHYSWETKKNWSPVISSYEEKLPDNKVLSVLIDHEGTYWAGTPAGVAWYDGTDWGYFTVDDGLVSNMILDMAEDKYGNIWFATDNGISYYMRNPVGIDETYFTKNFTNAEMNIYPQPLVNEATICYELQHAGQVNISVYSLNGKKISQIYNEYTISGPLRLRWNGEDNHGMRLQNGIYFLKLENTVETAIGKVLILRR